MKKKIWLPVLVFVAVMLLHFGVTVFRLPSPLATMEKLVLYLRQQSFWLGYSYALAAGFTVYALMLTIERRTRGMVGAVGGASWIGILYATGGWVLGCMAVGCCGSPLLVVYLGTFGSRLLGFAQPLVAVITTLSVLGGFFWLRQGTCRK